MLPPRDRFLIDLLTTSGIRVGEALSLFVADLHFGGGSQQLGCRHAEPHFHVRVNNPVENSARAKGGPRTLFVHRDLVESYIDYALERRQILEVQGVCDASPHLFVNLYSDDRWLGRAMTYSSVKRLLNRCSKRIGHDLSGPHMLRHIVPA
jgi:integrase/recombinase XerD